MTSFRTSITGTELCNRALDLIFAEPIASLDDQVPGVPARVARRWYKPTVAWLLERHHWNLATVRSPLTALVTNPRNARWQFAYQRPTDAAYIFGIAPSLDATGYYAALRSIGGAPLFDRVGDTIFSNVEGAAVDHTSYQVGENEFSEEFANVIVLSLAARFAMPVTKKASLQQKYEQDAANALAMAMARNANENMPVYGNTPTETEIVRGGWGIDAFWRGYPYDPAGIS